MPGACLRVRDVATFVRRADCKSDIQMGINKQPPAIQAATLREK